MGGCARRRKVGLRKMRELKTRPDDYRTGTPKSLRASLLPALHASSQTGMPREFNLERLLERSDSSWSPVHEVKRLLVIPPSAGTHLPGFVDPPSRSRRLLVEPHRAKPASNGQQLDACAHSLATAPARNRSWSELGRG
jgi:hypothetical protein